MKRLIVALFFAASAFGTPPVQIPTTVPGAKMPLRNAYAQSDIDLKGFKLVNVGGGNVAYDSISLSNSTAFSLILDSTDTSMTANRNLNFKVNDGSRTVSLFGDFTLSNSLSFSGISNANLNVATGGTLFDTDNTLTANSDAIISTQKAVKGYVDRVATGSVNDRGNYDASGNVFPSTGGSGGGGAIKRGDLWYISVGGTLGGNTVSIGSTIRALIDTPGQTAGNWGVLNIGAGFTRGAGTLTVSTTNDATIANHTHAITSSSNPGAAASLLATNSSGYLQLARLGIGTSPSQPLDVAGSVFIDTATANLYMKDTSTGLQAAATTVITPQSGNVMRNNSFASGIRGWNISDNGDAEFNNMLIRGELRASVFRINEITATAGTFGVFYSASTLSSDCTTPSVSGSFNFNAKNSDAGGALFGVNDIVRFKTWTGAGIGDSWSLITAVVNNGATSTYTATLESGSTAVTFTAGTAIVDYGPTGTGFITESADGTVGSSPNLSMATHSGSPWSSQTLLLREGNLNGSYGYVTNVYGIGIGSYGVSNQAWQTYDTINGIRIGNNTTTLAQWLANGNIVIGQVAASSPNITIDAVQGVQVRNNTTSLIQLDTSGNARFGQLATNQANLYWNASNQRVEFRGSTSGTVVQSYIDTDGSLVFGNGQAKLNASGLSFASPSGFSSTNAISWLNTGVLQGDISNLNNGSISLTQVTSIATGGSTAQTELDATNGSHFASLVLNSTGAFGFAALNGDGSTFQGLNIGANGQPGHMLEVHGPGWFKAGNFPFIIGRNAPITSSDTCEQGEVAWNNAFLFVCYATNTWKRVGISTF